MDYDKIVRNKLLNDWPHIADRLQGSAFKDELLGDGICCIVECMEKAIQQDRAERVCGNCTTTSVCPYENCDWFGTLICECEESSCYAEHVDTDNTCKYFTPKEE